MDWIGLGTSVGTVALVAVGWWQIHSLRRENKLERTLLACCRYESDPTIEGAVHELHKAWEEKLVQSDPSKYGHNINLLLNYLDTIAIGIEQKVYDEILARDYLESIVSKHVERYLNISVIDKIDCRISDYNRLRNLATRWTQGKTLYGRPWWKRIWTI
jgi:hypothetical protein